MLNIRYYLIRLMKRLKPRSIKNSKISNSAYIGGGSQIVNSTIGKHTLIAPDAVILNCTIGNFSSVGGAIGGAEHPIQMVTSSNLFVEGYSASKGKFYNHCFSSTKQTTIGNDVWVCIPSIVKAGVNIADGAVIGAGSVVTKNIGPYEIWAGNPAKFIRKRFDDDTIEKLLELKWWNWSDATIRDNAIFFDSPQNLINQMKEKKN